MQESRAYFEEQGIGGKDFSNQKNAKEWQKKDKDLENRVKDAFESAGLFNVRAPRPGTPAYQGIMEAAANYIAVVDHQVFESDQSPERKIGISSSNNARREYHNQLCLKIFGKRYGDLSHEQRGQISDFAAYLMDADEYVGTWDSKSSKDKSKSKKTHA